MEHDPQELIPSWFRKQPRGPQGVYKADVIRDIQRTLSVPETGVWDQQTESHVRGLQHLFGIAPSGVIDEETAVQIERLRNRYV